MYPSSLPNIDLQVLPTFPAHVQGSGPITVSKSGLTYTFGADFRQIMHTTALTPVADYHVLLQNVQTGAFHRASLADIYANFDPPDGSIGNDKLADNTVTDAKVYTPASAGDPNAVKATKIVHARPETGGIWRSVADRVDAGLADPRDFGTSANWPAAISAARAAAGINQPIVLVKGADEGYNYVALTSVYGGWANNSLGITYSYGTSSSPSTSALPVIRIEKVTASDRTDAEWDIGGLEVSVGKTGGNAPVAAFTSYVRNTKSAGEAHRSANTGIAAHARALAQGTFADVWAHWSYAMSRALSDADRVQNIIGHEININNRDADYGWMGNVARGRHDALVITTADGGPTVTWKTLNIVNGSQTATVNPDQMGLIVGMSVTGSGIPVGTTISAIVGKTLTLSQPATATAVGVPVTFTSQYSLPGQRAIRITNHTSGPGPATGWYTGIQISQNAILPTRHGHGEAVQIRGGSVSSRRFGGVRFLDGWFDYGISFVGDQNTETTQLTTASGSNTAEVEDPSLAIVGATITHPNVPGGTTVTGRLGTTITMSQAATGTGAAAASFRFGTAPQFDGDAAIWMRAGQRVIWGDSKTGSPYITISPDGYADIGGGTHIYPLFRLRAPAPSLSLSRQFTFHYINDTTVRFYLRGEDGTTRTADITFS